jgi:hypothetical protein
MPPFLPQSKLLFPDNANVSGQLALLGDTLGRAIGDYRNQQRLQAIGEAAKGGNYAAARDAAFGSGRVDLGIKFQDSLESQKNRAEDVGFRNKKFDVEQRNADRSHALDQQKVGLTAENMRFDNKIKLQELELRKEEIARKHLSIKDSLTPGQQAADKKFGADYADFTAAGGYADVDKQLKQLDKVADDLERISGGKGKPHERLTGPLTGTAPDWINAAINPAAIAARERVEEVAQRNLRIVLGAQFTQAEGDKLIARTYNPRLSEGENAKRVRALADQIRTAAKQKQSASEYFERNGTLTGFKGQLPSFTALGGDAPEASGIPALPPGFQLVK